MHFMFYVVLCLIGKEIRVLSAHIMPSLLPPPNGPLGILMNV